MNPRTAKAHSRAGLFAAPAPWRWLWSSAFLLAAAGCRVPPVEPRDLECPATVTALAFGRGGDLFIGLRGGDLLRWAARDQSPVLVHAGGGRAIAAMAAAPRGEVYVGYADGRLLRCLGPSCVEVRRPDQRAIADVDPRSGTEVAVLFPDRIEFWPAGGGPPWGEPLAPQDLDVPLAVLYDGRQSILGMTTGRLQVLRDGRVETIESAGFTGWSARRLLAVDHGVLVGGYRAPLILTADGRLRVLTGDGGAETILPPECDHLIQAMAATRGGAVVLRA